MHIKINLTEDIINQSVALHYINHPIGKKQRKKLYWIPLILLIVSAYLIYTELQLPAFTQNFYMALLYIAFAVSYYFFMQKRMMNSGQKILKNLGENAVFEMDITEEKVITTTSTTTITNDWSVFTSALISESNVLVYQADNSFIMFNYTFFQPSDFEQFKLWVREKISPLFEA